MIVNKNLNINVGGTMTETILIGDALEKLRGIDSGVVDCCVTSPPYYGLRDYGVEGQIGLEETPEQYIQRLNNVFREVRRVLRDDGTLWVNIGDSYCNTNGYARAQPKFQRQGRNDAPANDRDLTHLHGAGFKTKDLIGIPWMLAFALRADGWYLRQDIIWAKPNPMPSSVSDRCTSSHEYIFMLSKRQKYYFDAEAIKEPCVTAPRGNPKKNVNKSGKTDKQGQLGKQTYTGFNERYFSKQPSTTRNKRDVWAVPSKPYAGAHFATFPPNLIEPCILAGCRDGGVVLDPFMGSGTTCMVAKQNGRGYIGIELNPEYVELARKRIYEGTKDGKQMPMAI